MTKYTIEIEEQRTYRTTVAFESDLPKDKVEEILNKVKETNNCVDTDDLVGEIIDEGKFFLLSKAVQFPHFLYIQINHIVVVFLVPLICPI